jgi:hypothetical protein
MIQNLTTTHTVFASHAKLVKSARARLAVNRWRYVGAVIRIRVRAIMEREKLVFVALGDDVSTASAMPERCARAQQMSLDFALWGRWKIFGGWQSPTASTVNEAPTLVLAAGDCVVSSEVGRAASDPIHLDAPHNSMARRLAFTCSAERMRTSSAAA